jgi:hypothetical protein
MRMSRSFWIAGPIAAAELIGRIAPTRLESINLRGIFRLPISATPTRSCRHKGAAKTSTIGLNRPRIDASIFAFAPKTTGPR